MRDDGTLFVKLLCDPPGGDAVTKLLLAVFVLMVFGGCADRYYYIPENYEYQHQTGILPKEGCIPVVGADLCL